MTHELTRFAALVRTGLSLVPKYGNALSTAWAEWDSSRRMERIEQTLSAIADQLVDLELKTVDDAGMQLLELVLRQAEIEHAEQKRQRYACLLVSYWVADEPVTENFDEAAEFLRATAEFTEAHIAVLKILQDCGEEASVEFSAIVDVVQKHRGTEQVSSITLGLLEGLCARYGFVKRSWTLNREDKDAGLLRTANLGPEGIARKCYHAITKRGLRYLEFVLRGQ
jgi:hypothetical protein